MSKDDAPLRAVVTRSGSRVVVTLAGELDLATADSLRRRLRTLVQAAPPPSRLVLDAADLEFVDASGISVLLNARRSLADRGGELVLRSPSRLVRRVVTALDLEHLLPVER